MEGRPKQTLTVFPSTFSVIYPSKGNECAAGVRNTYTNTEQHRQMPTTLHNTEHTIETQGPTWDSSLQHESIILPDLVARYWEMFGWLQWGVKPGYNALLYLYPGSLSSFLVWGKKERKLKLHICSSNVGSLAKAS